jgi:hypothetical protein
VTVNIIGYDKLCKQSNWKIGNGDTMSKTRIFLGLVLALSLTPVSNAQESSDTVATEDDEVVAYGKKNWGHHEGMKAFFDGDFETAEIEFEKEFLGLKRGESAKENAAIDAANQSFRADLAGSVTGTSGGSSGGPGGGPAQGFDSIGSIDAGFASNFRKKRGTGRSTLTDGKVTYEDFAFSKYMAGLSEIKQGKISEAKKSLKQSLGHDYTNFDAQMRLGLIYVQEKDYDKAAKHLTNIDKLRRKCKIKSCDDKDFIDNAAVVLAKAITTSVEAQ